MLGMQWIFGLSKNGRNVKQSRTPLLLSVSAKPELLVITITDHQAYHALHSNYLWFWRGMLSILKIQTNARRTCSFNIWPKKPQEKKCNEEARKQFVICFHMIHFLPALKEDKLTRYSWKFQQKKQNNQKLKNAD